MMPREETRGRALARFKTTLSIAAVLAGAAWSTPSLAQTASPSQTRPGATAVEPSPPPHFSFPPAQGLSAPAGAERISFRLNELTVEGQFPELEGASNALKAHLIGQAVTVADVYAYAASLQEAYFAAGFPLARVVVPPQQLGADGRVRIIVVDGFVEAVDASQLPESVRGRVTQVLSPLIGQHHSTRKTLERRVLLAGDTAGLSLSSALAPGHELGGTVLVLSGEHELISGAFAADNRVDEQLGREQITTSVAFNSPFGRGDQFYATFAGYPDSDMFSDDARRRYLALGASVPLGDDGLVMGVSADYSSTRPKGNVAAQKLSGEYSRIGVWASYPIIRSRADNLTAHAAFDASSDVQRTDLGGPPTTTLSADRIRALRLGLRGDAHLQGDTHLSYSVGYSRGLNMLGARAQSDATPLKPLSRQGADAVFDALDASVSFASPALFGTTIAFNASGRYSFNAPLLRSEQFSPGGPDGLSGPPPGNLVGDSGIVSRVEWSNPQELGADGVVAPYAFVSAASVTLVKPTVLERANTDAHGYGAGLHFGLDKHHNGQYGVTGTLEWTRVESNQRDLTSDWTTAAIAVRF